MAKIILDAGSGNTCRNDYDYVSRMLDRLKEVDTGKHEVIIKWQLFKEAGDNITLKHNVFSWAYHYAKELGYKTTSSVFDKESLDFLLQFDPCFVKIANNRKLDWLIGEVPRKIPVYKSISKASEFSDDIDMLCVSKYPTTIEQYEKNFPSIGSYVKYSNCGVSDHTTNWDLFNKYKPEIIEVHYGLEDSTGLDAGPFMRTPAMLAEIL